MSSVLVLGDGILGSEIVRQTSWEYISRKKNSLDLKNNFQDFLELISPFETIVNCIAHTKTYDPNKELHWDLNYRFVADLVDFCNRTGKKLVQISTDYLYSNSLPSKRSEEDVPVHCANWYGYTKLLGDSYVQLRSKNYLLIRCSFKQRPWQFEKALIQKGNFDYTDTITKLIVKLIKKDSKGLFNVGTEEKTLLELAKQDYPKATLSIKKIHETFPEDITMDISKLKRELER